jgi:serine protease inhibitor
MGSSNPVAHVNALTKRWLAVQGDGSTVLSGLGVWPLLAFLADAANEPGRGELQEALGVSADEAAAAARELLDVVATMPAVRMALGLWSDAKLPLQQDWLDKLPLGTNQRLSGDLGADQKRLDAWASEHTDGLIPVFPLQIDKDTLLVLASALLVQTTWIQEFHTSWTAPRSGPWSGGEVRSLRRTTSILDRVCVASTPAGPVTALTVMGSDDVDVHLVLGEERLPPTELLALGVDVIGRVYPALTGDRLPEGTPGPGVTVERVRSYSRNDQLSVTTVPFSVTAEHDLVKIGRVFGLLTVADDEMQRLPGISEKPLCVQQGKQNAMAEFTATGFKAAAVTAFGIVGAAGIMPPPSFRIKEVSVVFDRPFAFYAVHRRTGLILAAGWVAEPAADPDMME